MNILDISIKNPFKLSDGGSIATFYMLKNLSALGYDVTFLMMNPHRHFSSLKDHKDIIEKLKLNVIEHKIDTNPRIIDAIRNLFFSKLPYILERFLDKEFDQKLIDLLSKNKYDIIMLEGSHLGLYLPTLKKYAPSTPIVLRSHNVEFEIWERTAKNETNILKKFFYGYNAARFKKWETATFAQYDAILPITNRDEKFIKQYSPNTKFHTLNFTLNLEDYPKQELTLKTISLAYMGALDWIPNQEGLVWFLDKVWSRIQGYYEGLKFYIAGRNAPDWLIKKIKHYDVEFLGEVPNAKEFMTEHPIFVVPLMAGGGMRIKIIEQMALGRVVISTPIGAEGIEIANMENIIIAETSDDFIKSIDYLFRNPDGIHYISDNARITIENLYNAEEAYKELDSFFKKLLK